MQSTRDSKILNQVAQTYETIAESWDRVRRRPAHVWDILLPYIANGSTVLDVACGNGRLSEFLASKNVGYTGIDGSQALITIAASRYPQAQFLRSTMLSLPVLDVSHDVVCCLAALQHLPSRSTRIQALREMLRVSKPGGRLLLTNWNLYHPSMLLRFRLWRLLVGMRDVMVPWKLPEEGTVVGRYYHSFLLRELDDLLTESGWSVDTLQYVNGHGPVHWMNGLFSFAVATRRAARV